MLEFCLNCCQNHQLFECDPFAQNVTCDFKCGNCGKSYQSSGPGPFIMSESWGRREKRRSSSTCLSSTVIYHLYHLSLFILPYYKFKITVYSIILVHVYNTVIQHLCTRYPHAQRAPGPTHSYFTALWTALPGL